MKKTLTIPPYLERLASDQKINYSHVLQAGLIYRLGITDTFEFGPAPGNATVNLARQSRNVKKAE